MISIIPELIFSLIGYGGNKLDLALFNPDRKEGSKERFLRYASDPILRMGPHFLAALGMTTRRSICHFDRREKSESKISRCTRDDKM